MYGAVLALAVDSGGTVYAGGFFSGPPGANRIARWNGTNWSALGTGMNQAVYALAFDGAGNLYAGGNFTTAGGASANRIARWNGASWSAIGPGMNDFVFALAVDGEGTVCAGGQFTTAGGSSVNHIASWNGTNWLAQGQGMNSAVFALAVDGVGNLYAGGGFTAAGSTNANRIARWNGTRWSALGTGMDNSVLALAVDGGGNLYAGGVFTTVGGVSANYVAQWDGTSWLALGPGMNDNVNALAVDGGGTLFAGGSFTTAGGTSANHIAQWNGTSWSALGTGMNSDVFALAVEGGGNLYAGGVFTTAGGTSASSIARWNGTNWSALGTGMNDAVFALAVDGGGNLYAGGQFTSAGGTSANAIAKWNGTSWSALGAGMSVVVYALAVDGEGNLQAGGSFTTAGGTSANHIAEWNGTSWSALGAGTNFPVQTVAVDEGTLYAGGLFTTAGGKASYFVAELGPPDLRYADADGDGYGDPSVSLSLCGTSPGYVTDHTDCDDTRASVHPGAPELCDGLDNDCNGQADERHLGPSGIVSLWEGEGNANDAVDGNHGTAQNGATFVPGWVDQCFRFDGVDDIINDLGTPASFSFVQNTGVFTIEGWINLDDPDAPREQTIAANIFSAADKGFSFGVDNSGGQHGLHMMLSLGGSLIIDSHSPDGLINTLAWHHVAAVGNGSQVTFYVDGAAHAGSGTMGALSSGDATRAMDLGWNNVGSYFGGHLDELAIYDEALSASVIQAIYNAGSTGRCGLISVDEPAASAPTLQIGAPRPNPARRSVDIEFQAPLGATVTAQVIDVAGRKVATLADRSLMREGRHRVHWDCRDASSQLVAPGVYLLRISAGRAVAHCRIVVLQ